MTADAPRIRLLADRTSGEVSVLCNYGTHCELSARFTEFWVAVAHARQLARAVGASATQFELYHHL